MATSIYRTIQANFTEGVQFVKNYVPNATFQNGSKNGWSLFNTTLTSGLPTGALTLNSAASITTFDVTQTNPISGSYSLQTASSGVWSAGQGIITDAFTIEREDLGKPLTFSLSFEAITNPTNANWSGILGSQTFAVYIYDVTASAWIQPSGFLGMNQSSGVGQVMGSFQSSVTAGQQYRLAIIALQASSGAITINFDNFSIGKEKSTVGTPVTDYISYTPTCNWTSGYTITGQYRRIGDSIECIVKLTCTGAPIAASETTFSIPSGLTIDTAKLLSPAQGTAPTYGDAIGYDISVLNLYLFRVQYWTTTTVKLFYQSSSTGQESAVTTAVPPSWSTNDTIIAKFTVPIVGFSSSVQMSNTTDTRVVAALIQASAASQSLTANTPISWGGGAIFDTHGAYNGTTTYTIPVSGYYEIKISEIYVSANNYMYVYKNGSPLNGTGTLSYLNTTSYNGIGNGSIIDRFNAGDTVTIVPGGSVTLNYSAGNYRAKWSIQRLSGPSVIGASDSIGCQYTDTSGYVISSPDTLLSWGTKVFDLTNSMNAGTYTVPVSGKYLVSVVLEMASTTLSTTTAFSVSIVQNGTEKQRYSTFGSGGNNAYYTGGSIILSCLAGDTIQIKHASGTSSTGNTTAGRNNISIMRVGN